MFIFIQNTNVNDFRFTSSIFQLSKQSFLSVCAVNAPTEEILSRYSHVLSMWANQRPCRANAEADTDLATIYRHIDAKNGKLRTLTLSKLSPTLQEEHVSRLAYSDHANASSIRGKHVDVSAQSAPAVSRRKTNIMDAQKLAITVNRLFQGVAVCPTPLRENSPQLLRPENITRGPSIQNTSSMTRENSICTRLRPSSAPVRSSCRTEPVISTALSQKDVTRGQFLALPHKKEDTLQYDASLDDHLWLFWKRKQHRDKQSAARKPEKDIPVRCVRRKRRPPRAHRLDIKSVTQNKRQHDLPSSGPTKFFKVKMYKTLATSKKCMASPIKTSEKSPRNKEDIATAAPVSNTKSDTSHSVSEKHTASSCTSSHSESRSESSMSSFLPTRRPDVSHDKTSSPSHSLTSRSSSNSRSNSNSTNS